MSLQKMLNDYTSEQITIVNNLLDDIICFANENQYDLTQLKTNDELSNYSSIVTKCCILTNIGRETKKKRKMDLFLLKQANENEQKKIRKYKTCYICRFREQLNENDNSLIFEEYKCEKCNDINLIKRNIRANLTGKIAIVTGGRVKIGYETVIRLLECNCCVIATSRFLADMLKRYKSHPNYNSFSHLLILYALDLRYQKDIDEFYNFVKERFTKIDILIHNAAQTIRRPREFYQHLIHDEMLQFKQIENVTEITNLNNLNNSNNSNSTELILRDDISNHLTKVFGPLTTDDQNNFPIDQFDNNGEQIDLRKTNTWIKKLGDIDMTELTELLTINTLAPFHMNQIFKNLLINANGSYIVNVSSMEGIFNMKFKSKNHPHTNMAKSALNMMTRTSAHDYKKYNIFMISVDTGWITNEFPYEYESSHINYKSVTPLDNLDGACRILDPIFSYYNGNEPLCGVFLKDYEISEW